MGSRRSAQQQRARSRLVTKDVACRNTQSRRDAEVVDTCLLE
ncbi:hypothetical protein VPHD480_0381 [Vibrio phage D480]